MARGKKTDNETIYKIMTSMFVTNNLSETSRLLGIPIKTVEGVYKKNKDSEEFAKLGNEKKTEFVDRANKIIDKATELLDRRLATALNRQGEIETLLDIVSDADYKDIDAKEKLAIARKLARIELNALNEITTAIGTMYDKRALASGDPTSNMKVTYEEALKKAEGEHEY